MSAEEIMAGRVCILNALEKENKKLADIVREKDWLVASVMIETRGEQYFFIIFDPTSRQEDHFHDIEKYSLELYYRFNRDCYNV